MAASPLPATPPAPVSGVMRDAAAGGLLVVCLALVYATDRGQPKSEPTIPVEPTITEQAAPAPVPQAPRMRLAVTHPESDDMGKLLKTLGPGYQFTTLSMDQLLDPATFENYDVLFFTCSGVPDSWVTGTIGDANRPGFKLVTVKEGYREKRDANLRNFVERGGTLYVSDRHLLALAQAFPEIVDGSSIEEARKQTVRAQVVDQGLASVIGESIELNFDSDAWVSARFRGDATQVLLRGTFETLNREQIERPLLVRFPSGQGTVIFTCFHNEKVNDQLEIQLLKFLVFSSVLAKAESQARETLVSAGFRLGNRSMLSTSREEPSYTRTYHCSHPGRLRFILTFENVGAHLRLKVVAPDGRDVTREGTSTITVDIENAAQGDWKYTVTALKIPFDNFPHSLTIGEQ